MILTTPGRFETVPLHRHPGGRRCGIREPGPKLNMTKVFKRTRGRLSELTPVVLPEEMVRRRKSTTTTTATDTQEAIRAGRLMKRKRARENAWRKRLLKMSDNRRPFKSEKDGRALYTIGGGVVRQMVSGGLPGLGKRR